jgi:hypothetical protein
MEVILFIVHFDAQAGDFIPYWDRINRICRIYTILRQILPRVAFRLETGQNNFRIAESPGSVILAGSEVKT